MAKIGFINGVVAPAASQSYPYKDTCWMDENKILTGNAQTSEFNASQQYATMSYRASPADGDSFSQNIFLATGTYTLGVLGVTNSLYGKVDWYLGATKIADGQDWYSADQVYNITKTQASINVATAGIYELKAVVNGKNGSSSNYYLVLTKFWMTRTGDPS